MNISLQRSLLASNFGLLEFEDRNFLGFQSPWIFSSQNSRVPCFVDSMFSSLEISPHRFTSKFALFFLQTSTKSKSFQQIYKSTNYIFFLPFLFASFFKFLFFLCNFWWKKLGRIRGVSGPYQGRIRAVSGPKLKISIFFCGFGISGF